MHVLQRGSPRDLPERAPLEVAVNLKKVVTWLIVAFVVFYVIQAPEASAQLVRNAGQALGDAASSLAAFVGSVV
jgi:large-conductance mechanosensitive channel